MKEKMLALVPRLSRKEWILFGVAIGVACFLRFAFPTSFPLPVNQDELSNIYDGWSIGTTGADRFGTQFPLVVEAFGPNDSRPALFMWLLAIPEALFGPSVAAGRGVNAFFGVASLIILFFFLRRWFNFRFAFIALCIGTLTPWSLIFSRIALEGSILPSFFAILIVYLFFLAREKDYPYPFLIAVGFLCGFSANLYQSTRLTSVLFVLTVAGAVLLRYHSIRSSPNFSTLIKKIGTLGVFAAIGAFPQLYLLISAPENFFGRASETMIPASFSFGYFKTLLVNVLANFSPEYLFLSPFDESNISVGRLLPITALFFYPGLALLPFAADDKKKRGFMPYVYLFALIAIFPAAPTNFAQHPIRTSAFMLFAIIFTAGGASFLIDRIKTIRVQQWAVIAALALILANGVYYIVGYASSRNLRESNMQHYLVALNSAIGSLQTNYDKVYIINHGNQPYVYTAFYTKITPREFQSIEKDFTRVDGWQRFRRLGKYYYIDHNDMERAYRASRGKNEDALFAHTERLPGARVVMETNGYLLMDYTR